MQRKQFFIYYLVFCISTSETTLQYRTSKRAHNVRVGLLARHALRTTANQESNFVGVCIAAEYAPISLSSQGIVRKLVFSVRSQPHIGIPSIVVIPSHRRQRTSTGSRDDELRAARKLATRSSRRRKSTGIKRKSTALFHAPTDRQTALPGPSATSVQEITEAFPLAKEARSSAGSISLTQSSSAPQRACDPTS